MASSGARSSRERVAEHRRRLRDRGLRPVQLWVPDTRGAGFTKAAHEQSAAVAASAGESDDRSFVDDISWDFSGDDPDEP